jgi:hypothetical protein
MSRSRLAGIAPSLSNGTGVPAHHLSPCAWGPRRAESDRKRQTIVRHQETVKSDRQNVKTAVMNPAVRAFTRSLKWL